MQATKTKYINTEIGTFILFKQTKTPICKKTPLSNRANFDNPDPVQLDFLNLELLSA